MRTLVQCIVSLLLIFMFSISYSFALPANDSKTDQTTLSQISITGESSAVVCYGGNDGYINITVSGGIAPYSYIWSNSLTTEDISLLTAGQYSVTVTDVNNATATASFTINGPAQVISLSGFTVDASCYNGNDGGISLSTTGGSPPYTWLWNDGTTTEDRNGLHAGNYVVVVSDFGGNCTQMNFSINQAAKILANPLIINNTCYGAKDGAIEVVPSQGYQPYTFLWSNGENSSLISDLEAGSYSVTITDANNCSSVNSINISQPQQVIQIGNIISDITCFGLANGEININILGGTAPYAYNWSNGHTSQDVSNLNQGNYFVVVTDNDNNCSKDYFSVIEPDQLLLNGIVTNPACNMTNTGSIDITVEGGVPPYSFSWDNGAVSEDLSSLNAGDYSVLVTDANGCSYATSFSLTQPDLLSIQSFPTNISCFGGHNGAVNITVMGGTQPYFYFWSNGSNVEDLSNLSIGQYSVTVMDALGCLANAGPFSLTQPTTLTMTDSIVMVSCHGANNGKIYLTPHGGTPIYHYTWNDWSTSQYRTDLTPGQYTVTVTDSHGCEVWKSIIVTQPSGMNILGQTTNASCFGMSNGSISLTVNGGVAPYSYLWSDQNTTEDRDDILANNYSVTVTDNNGCQNISSFNVTQPDSLILSTAITNISCFGSHNGMIDVSVTGGTAPFQFLWNDGVNTEDRSNLAFGNYYLTISDFNGCSAINHAIVAEPAALNANGLLTNLTCFGDNSGIVQLEVIGGTSPYSYLWSNGSTQNHLSQVPAGTYSVIITDFNNCQVSKSYTITQPTEIIITPIVTNINCNGNANGSINISLSGGILPLSYVWNTGQTTLNLSNLSHGVYTITITDNSNCIKTQTFEITEPEVLSHSGTISNISCFGLLDGAINLTVTGGTNPYIYNWSSSASSQDLSNLGAGTYFVTITDDNDCQSIGTFSITEPSQLTLSLIPAEISCHNGSNGAINLTVSGGTPVFSYLWSNNAATEDLSDLIHGTYSVIVTDHNNCSESLSVTLNNPANIVQVTSAITPVSCTNGSNGAINLTPTNGTAPFTYLWNDGSANEDLAGLGVGNYSVTIYDAGSNCSVYNFTVSQISEMQTSAILVNNSCYAGTIGEINTSVSGGANPFSYSWSNGNTTEDLVNLAAGLYTLTITDANLCTKISNWSISQPSAVSITGTVTDVSCNGGTNGEISIAAAGGTPNYTYLWSTGSVLTNASALIAGDYDITVTDLNLCESVFTYTVNEPSLIVLSTSHENSSCFGGTNGTINLTVSGGVAPYSYVWNTGSSDEDISELPAGDYTVTVTDDNGCESSIISTVSEPVQLISITSSIILVSCPGGNNGSIDITAAGGSNPYSYSWSNGNSTEDITGLAADLYSVTVTDAGGFCSVFSITVNEVNPITINSSVTDVSCNGFSDGAIELAISDGNSPYTFLWSNQSADQNISDLNADSYNVTVTDFAGCSASASIQVNEPDPLQVNASITNATCFGSGTGAIALIVNGGTGPYHFTWNNGSVEQDLTNLIAGDYSVTVSDKHSCTLSETFTILEYSNVTGVIPNAFQVLNCSGDNIVPFEFIPDNYLPEEITYTWIRLNTALITGMPQTGSSPAIGYLANPTSNTLTETFLITPSYNGCQGAHLQASIVVPAAFTAFAVAEPILCNSGLSTVHVSGSGGTQPYPVAEIFNVPAGFHEFTIQDYNGCTTTTSLTINEPAAITINSAVVNNFCQNATNGVITLTTTGGTPPYTYLWNDGNTNGYRSNLPTGLYHVTATDANGCEANQSVEIFYSHISATAFMTTEPYACQGTPHQFTVYLTGSKPFTLRYTNFTDTVTVLNINTYEYDFYVNVLQNSQYKLISVTDVMCAGNVYGGTYFIQSEPLPTAAILPHSAVCPGESTQLQVNLTGHAPWNITWFDGTNHQVNNIFQSPYFINVAINTTHTYSLNAVSDSYCNATNLGQPVVLSVNNKPTATISGTTFLCGGQTANLHVELTGTPPWTIVVNNESGDTTISNILTNLYTLSVIPQYSAIYTVVSVTDNNCSSVGTGSATVTLYERPFAHISGPSHTCQGQASNLFINLSGTPPWQLIWTDGQTTHSLSNVLATPVMISVGPDSSTNYFLTQLLDYHCNAILPSDTFALNIADPPTAQIVGPSTSCFGIGTDVFVNLTGTPPWTIAWNDTTTHIVTGILTTPYTFHIDPSSVTNYWVTQVSDAFCNGNSIGFPLVVSVAPTADVEISGISTVNQLCAGGSVSINLTFSSALPPFIISYFDYANNEHVISGITQDTTLTIIPPLNEGTYNYTFLYVSDENGCTHNYNTPFSITVLPLPYVNAGSDTLISYGQSVALLPTISGNSQPFAIQWSPATYLNDPTILNPISSPMAGTTYTLSVIDNNGCSNSDQVLVDVNVTRTVFGTIKYDNTNSTLLNNVTVFAINGNDTAATTITNPSGFYQLTDLPDGNYHLKFLCTKPFGGVNATDALIILRHFVQLTQLSGIRKLCADVDGSQYVNSSDALFVSKRFTGQIGAFTIGDWVFQNTEFTIPAINPEYNVLAICSGDANGSYVPAAKYDPAISIENQDVIQTKNGDDVVIPFKINRLIEANSLSLILNYPTDKYKITGIETPGLKDASYAIEEGTIHISWYSLVTATLAPEAPVLLLHVRILNANSGSDDFTISGPSEFADKLANPLFNTNLIYPKLQTMENLVFSGTIYPNPVRDQLSVYLNLPEDSKISVQISNTLGEQITVLKETQYTSGNHTITYNTSNLRPGVYNCIIGNLSGQKPQSISTKFIIAR